MDNTWLREEAWTGSHLHRDTLGSCLEHGLWEGGIKSLMAGEPVAQTSGVCLRGVAAPSPIASFQETLSFWLSKSSVIWFRLVLNVLILI